MHPVVPWTLQSPSEECTSFEGFPPPNKHNGSSASQSRCTPNARNRQTNKENANPNQTMQPQSYTHQTDQPADFVDRQDYQQSEDEGYLELGDASYTCKHCAALFWYEERVEKNIASLVPNFSICCQKGKVTLPYLSQCPNLLLALINGVDQRGKSFIDNIRSYNSMFAFTSMGAKIQTQLNNGGGPPQFIISGQNYHRMGTLLPAEGASPKFAQLYVYDTKTEVVNRLAAFSHGMHDQLDSSLVSDLMVMIDQHNVLAKTFRMARDYIQGAQVRNLTVKLFRGRQRDPRTYNLPSVDGVAALIVGDFDSSDYGRDIIVHTHEGQFQRIHETHTSYMPLQYPLLFPYGEDGYQEDIKFAGSEASRTRWKRKRVSLREFISFRIQQRQCEKSILLRSRRLFQQFVVDCYSMIEAQRLSFIRNNQGKIRQDFLSGVQEAVDRGDINPSSIGSRIVLPSSFVGGRRYMFKNCQDAMAVCKYFGYPDLFITVTCNPKWLEIQRFLNAYYLNSQDRPDIVCRIFHLKLEELMKDFKKNHIFGKVVAGMYTIEFQKRGLPHAHILSWMDSEHKFNTTERIDSIISAELPDPTKYPTLFQMVSSSMVHGPCGVLRKESPCMQNGRCSKHFPKPFAQTTSFDVDGYPIYKRRNTGITTTRGGIVLDNRYVVPYNPKLLMRYQAHINIECCNKSTSIKYLFKYISKGVDRVTMSLGENQDNNDSVEQVDEIKQYYDCRYLSPCESAWRILAFDIHQRWPPVQKVTFHLPEEQVVLFQDTDPIDSVLYRNKNRQTMFLAWMYANTKFPDGQHLTYSEYPTLFIYDVEDGEWKPRKRGFSIGRMNFISPGVGELYYLRLLLNVQRGCTNYEAIRTVNGQLFPTFRDACGALGLLDDDKEFIDGIIEASKTASSSYLRRLFVSLLMSNTMSKPYVVWEHTWTLLADDILYAKRQALNLPDLTIPATELENFCLVEVEKLLLSNGKSLKNFDNIPFPISNEFDHYSNVLLFNALNFNVNEMETAHQDCLAKLNSGQRSIYDQVMKAATINNGGFFFVYGHGGTGKTFLWKTLTYGIRSKGKIILNVASSGIASLLLPGGRTAHSQFLIPLSLNEDSCCSIKQGSFKAELLQHTSLIIWDEAPMVNKWVFEALDRTLKDIMRFHIPDSGSMPFGGKVLVLGGDFCQILPVIPKGNRADIVMSTVNSSYLWKHCTILRLTENMRLKAADRSIPTEVVNEFANWVLAIGNGGVGKLVDDEVEVEIPPNMLITSDSDPIQDIVNFTYPNIMDHFGDYYFFQDKAILAPTLEVVEEVNQYVMSMVDGEEKTYLSCDSVWKTDEETPIQADWMTTEFLNSIRCSGMPDHKLVLKKGVSVMLMRNLDISSGLCNGTRLIVVELGINVIGAKVVNSDNNESIVFIPRMNLIPSYHLTPIRFQRRQFPLTVSFAMTINKSQGQTLSRVGIYLPRLVFSHGQLYVAISRVKCPTGLKIVIRDDSGLFSSKTKNVVYNEVFQKI